jgi:pimeloyl-ACP methyl ester carboxylesterase
LGSGRNLRTLAQRWSERAPELRFLLPDLRGHGESPPLPAEGATLSLLAADVLTTARALALPTPFRIVGHSLGGRVALAAARLAPQEVRAVDLLDIGASPIDPARSDSRRVLDVLVRAPEEAADRRELRGFLVGEGLSLPLAEWLLLNLETHAGRVRWRIDRAALDRFHATSMSEDLFDVITRGQVPVRCVRGGRSRYVSDGEAARLATAGCPVDLLADAGHFVHVDALPALLSWLDPRDA